MLEDPQTERSQGQRRKRGVKRADEVLVEPLCLFYLETYSLDGFELFGWEVYDEPDT